jgi:ferric-dicitrate binding protein FerR (iron transport regulator)
MSKQDKNMSDKDLDHLSSKILNNLDIQFSSSKEEAWESLESQMKEDVKKKSSIAIYRYSYLAVAASLVVLLMVGSFLRFNNTTINSQNKSLAIILPDESNVNLHPNSQLTYYQSWWKINRNLKLSGTADFQVSKGKRFQVVSEKGKTEVLGTSFRIETDKVNYTVSCFSGSVKVSDSKSDVSAILTANEVAELIGEGVFEIKLIKKTTIETKAENSFLTFRNKPIQEVFTDLESQFGVNIELSEPLDMDYSGNLKKDLNFEEILNAVCLPLGLEYEQKSENTYLILPGAAN